MSEMATYLGAEAFATPPGMARYCGPSDGARSRDPYAPPAGTGPLAYVPAVMGPLAYAPVAHESLPPGCGKAVDPYVCVAPLLPWLRCGRDREPDRDRLVGAGPYKWVPVSPGPLIVVDSSVGPRRAFSRRRRATRNTQHSKKKTIVPTVASTATGAPPAFCPSPLMDEPGLTVMDGVGMRAGVGASLASHCSTSAPASQDVAATQAAPSLCLFFEHG